MNLSWWNYHDDELSKWIIMINRVLGFVQQIHQRFPQTRFRSGATRFRFPYDWRAVTGQSVAWRCWLLPSTCWMCIHSRRGRSRRGSWTGAWTHTPCVCDPSRWATSPSSPAEANWPAGNRPESRGDDQEMLPAPADERGVGGLTWNVL